MKIYFSLFWHAISPTICLSVEPAIQFCQKGLFWAEILRNNYQKIKKDILHSCILLIPGCLVLHMDYGSTIEELLQNNSRTSSVQCGLFWLCHTGHSYSLHINKDILQPKSSVRAYFGTTTGLCWSYCHNMQQKPNTLHCDDSLTLSDCNMPSEAGTSASV